MEREGKGRKKGELTVAIEHPSPKERFHSMMKPLPFLIIREIRSEDYLFSYSHYYQCCDESAETYFDDLRIACEDDILPEKPKIKSSVSMCLEVLVPTLA
jgi:hypothetical protein